MKAKQIEDISDSSLDSPDTTFISHFLILGTS